MSDAETQAALDRAWGFDIVHDDNVPFDEVLVLPGISPRPAEAQAEYDRRRAAGSIRITGIRWDPAPR